MNHQAPVIGPSWEFRMIVNLLKKPMEKLANEHCQARNELVASARILQLKEVGDFINSRLGFLIDWSERVSQFGPAFNAVMSPNGKVVNEQEIHDVCREYLVMARLLVDWEKEIASIHPPASWEQPYRRLRGATTEWFDLLYQMVIQIEQIITNPKASGTYHLNMAFNTPSVLDKQFTREVAEAVDESRPFWDRHPFLTGGLLGIFFGLWS